MGELTPEDRAERLLSRLDREGDISVHPDHDERVRAINVIGAEIRAAVDAEREACAKLCDQRVAMWESACSSGDLCDEHDVIEAYSVEAENTAIAIRARGKL